MIIQNKYDQNIQVDTYKSSSNKTAVIFLHGIEGHSLWFKDSAIALSNCGIDVFAYDRIGSGRSAGLKGQIVSQKQLLEDFKTVYEYVNSFKYKKIGIVASCWGAKLAILTEHSRLFNLDFLILISPAIFVKIKLDIFSLLNVIYSNLTFNFNKLINLPITIEMLTDNSIKREELLKDNYRNLAITASSFLNHSIISQNAINFLKRIRTKTLVCFANNDTIIDISKSINDFNSIKNNLITIKIYDSSSHCLDFDNKIFNDLISDITSWVKLND